MSKVVFRCTLLGLCHFRNLGVVLVLIVAVDVAVTRAGRGVDGALSFLETAGRNLGSI